MILCWSAKGGSGTTVVAASLALVIARSAPTLLVDTAGDLAAALGIAEPSGPGLGDWLSSAVADADSLHRIAVQAAPNLHLVARGACGSITTEQWARLAAATQRTEPCTVIDLGTSVPPPALADTAEQSLLVIRPCYLALRRVVQRGHTPDGVVLVGEPGRALNASDVARSVGAPVMAQIPYDPAVARAVDAGLLAARLPRSIAGPLEELT
jgi:MinD-like ATPase involved in chromosome partitioning or flagellar assembly